ncbi:MAG: ABC transporter permease subunit [Methanospirillum sp.]|nr:ABC transporter permease subunit [Methanospirillum sp.]
MNWRAVRAVAAKDLLEVRKNRMATWSILGLSVFFSVGMPLLIGLLPFAAGPSGGDLGPFEQLTRLLPPGQQDLPIGSRMVVLMLGYFLAPLFLIIPLMVSSIVGAESFVGEKERGTLEGLLFLPATDLELYAGKVLAGFVPAVAAAFLNFALYAVMVNLVSAPIVGGAWFPTVPALALAAWVGPAVALLGVSASVLVSTRVETVLEANQVSGLLSLVIVALMVGQGSGLLMLSLPVLFLIGLAIYGVDVLLVRFGAAVFSRDRLMARA